MEKFIKGKFKKSIFKSDKGFIIGLFNVKDTNDPLMDKYINKTITITGTFASILEDETYVLFGDSMKHPRYGFQYNVVEYERVKPNDIDGIVEFLSSDLFPGVGEKLATKIVDKLGLNALELIMEDITVLSNIPKLSTKKITSIYENLIKYEESHAIIVYLSELGFAIKDCMTIYNEYKGNTKQIINENIYKLVNLTELSFQKVDTVALKELMKEDSPLRIKSAIIYVMEKITNNDGDTFISNEKIRKELEKFIKFPLATDFYDDLMFELTKEKEIIEENGYYYLKDIYNAETYVSNRILKLASYDSKKNKKITNYLENLEEMSNITYNEMQKLAITKAIENNVLIITGGPGTGKTTIIKAIVELYSQLNNISYDMLTNEITLIAPTGRAAKRMSESTNLPASTIHRFLKWNKDLNKFSVNEYETSDTKLVIIDESSMIDIKLMDSLFRGINEKCKVIFVGDYNQLPSVGPGNVLKDLIESEVIDTVFLEHLYRTSEDSYINTLACEIKTNELSENFLKKRSDYAFLQCSELSLVHNLSENMKFILSKNKFDYKKIQIIAPMYAGINGIDNLNYEMQKIFNPPSKLKKEMKVQDFIFREGDKVLQLKNQPDDNVFNGDIGIIEEIREKELVVLFDNFVVTYNSSNINNLKHAYVISIHKSQGSEFDIVILPICNSYKRMLYRKLIYTAVTRAKKKLIIIGESTAFLNCVNNDNEYVRSTSLIDKIQNMMYKK